MNILRDGKCMPAPQLRIPQTIRLHELSVEQIATMTKRKEKVTRLQLRRPEVGPIRDANLYFCFLGHAVICAARSVTLLQFLMILREYPETRTINKLHTTGGCHDSAESAETNVFLVLF